MVSVKDERFIPSIENDQLKIAVIERHHQTGNIGVGIVKGFQLEQGALATTVAHDSHNIVVVGTNDEDMLYAANQFDSKRWRDDCCQQTEGNSLFPLTYRRHHDTGTFFRGRL